MQVKQLDMSNSSDGKQQEISIVVRVGDGQREYNLINAPCQLNLMDEQVKEE